MKRYARPALAVVFVAMLATPAIIRRVSDRGAHSAAAAGDARQRYGFQLTEVSRASGISFVHEAPTLDPKLTHIMPQVASMGAAVAIVDVDADGHADVYVTNSKEGSKNRLYRNRGDGTFEEVAERLGVADLNQPRNRRLHGSRVRRLRQRRLRGSLPLSMGTARTVSQRAGTPLHARHGYDIAAGLGQHQYRGVARLRSRRSPRSLSRRLLSGALESLEARRHEDHAGELRICEQRREEVPLSQSRRRPIRRSERKSRAELHSLGTRGRRRGSAWNRLPRSVHRQRLRRIGALHQRRRPVPRGRPPDRCGLCAEERHERIRRRCVQPGETRRVRVEYLRGRHPAPGQQPVGADRWIEAAAGVREHGARYWPRPGRMELRRAVRRSEQRRIPGSVSRQRLRVRLTR